MSDKAKCEACACDKTADTSFREGQAIRHFCAKHATNFEAAKLAQVDLFPKGGGNGR